MNLNVEKCNPGAANWVHYIFMLLAIQAGSANAAEYSSSTALFHQKLVTISPADSGCVNEGNKLDVFTDNTYLIVVPADLLLSEQCENNYCTLENVNSFQPYFNLFFEAEDSQGISVDGYTTAGCGIATALTGKLVAYSADKIDPRKDLGCYKNARFLMHRLC